MNEALEAENKRLRDLLLIREDFATEQQRQSTEYLKRAEAAEARCAVIQAEWDAWALKQKLWIEERALLLARCKKLQWKLEIAEGYLDTTLLRSYEAECADKAL